MKKEDNNRRNYKGLLRELTRVVHEKHLAKCFTNSKLSNNGSLKWTDDVNHVTLKNVILKVS